MSLLEIQVAGFAYPLRWLSYGYGSLPWCERSVAFKGMMMKFKMLFIVLILVVTACGESDAPGAEPAETGASEASAEDTEDTAETSDDNAGDTADDTTGNTTEDGNPDNPCAYPLVKLQTGQSQTCDGGNEHHWPIGMDESDCHGWQGMDNSGGVHNNSANTIRCNEDGTFEFTQYAGNLNCEGSGVRKVYSLNTCEQDIPPMLYTVAIDLTCCSEPESPQCATGVPSAGPVGAEISLNGVVCDE